MTKEMLSAKEIAQKWGITPRRVNQLCNSNQIEGATKIGGLWKIPNNALAPDTLRDKHKQKLLPCPVGISSYKEVSSECYYVDKTLLIKELIDNHNKVTLFTRPRRFGKTLTMDMLKTYFEKTDEDTSIYFKNQNIWICGNEYTKHQGKYPVIFLTFKDAKRLNWEDTFSKIKSLITFEFMRHNELETSDVLDVREKRQYCRFADGNINESECQSALQVLSSLLHKHYGKECIIIVDEYDTPINQGYNYGFYDETINFMRNFFSDGFKDNNNLEFGILTGILRVAKESLFSGLNNLTVNTILDDKYSNYFGFTTKEVEDMATYYKQENKLEEINKWYDGYRFGNTEIFNPWSVINYFNNNCVPKSFWSRTSSNDMILEIIKNGNLEIQDSLINLLQDKPIQANVDIDIIYPEIGKSVDSVYSFLLVTGYLKIKNIINNLDDNPICNLLIPNKEVKGVFKKEIIDNLTSKSNNSVIRNFYIALKTNNKDALQDTIHKYLLNSISFFDTNTEYFYHGMMLGLLAVMSDEYLITSNRETGEGRFDVQLKPISNNFPGIIMEFKAANNADEKTLESLADKAIEQINKKGYITELKANNINDIHLYGIAFSKKKVAVKSISLK